MGIDYLGHVTFITKMNLQTGKQADFYPVKKELNLYHSSLIRRLNINFHGIRTHLIHIISNLLSFAYRYVRYWEEYRCVVQS